MRRWSERRGPRGSWIALVVLVTLAGCGAEEMAPDAALHAADADPHADLDVAPDGGPSDADPPADAVSVDAGPADAASGDASVDDAGDASAALPDTVADAGAEAATDGMPTDLGPDAPPDMAPRPDAAVVEPAVLAYCDCMFLGCHDLYHQLWGEDEGVARARCFRVGSELPRDPDAVEGDSLDCRRHWCDEAYDLDDPGLCDRAGGQAVCL